MPRRIRRRKLRVGRLLLLCGSLLVLALVAVGAEQVQRALATLPPLSDPSSNLGSSSVVYDREGQPVALVPGPQDRQPVSISQVPPLVQHAFIAVEDKRFYANNGIDVRGILRALVADLEGRPLQGGSTITQELAKNLYLTPVDTITRKIKEAILAIELNRRYTKPEILQMYLNWIYLGEHAYGIQAAAETYFGVSVNRLNIAQAALLAGLPQEPVGYDPYYHEQAALDRRNTVIGLMAAQHYITPAEALRAKASPIRLQPLGSNPGNGQIAYPYPWFMDAVILQLEQQDHLSPEQVVDGGLKIYTTLEPRIQDAAQQAIASLPQSEFPLDVPNPMQAAMVVLDQSNGDVVAVVGGRTHTTMLAYDRALVEERQPGSSIKPLVDYIPALESGLTAGTVVDDRIIAYHLGPGQPTYTPTDDNPPYYGLTTFTEALRRSVNTVAVQVLQHIGIQNGFDNAVRMGLPLTPADLHLSLAIGGTHDCCSPLNMAAAYAAIANGGARVTPRLITRVVAPDGSVLVDNPPALRQVIDPRIAFIMTRMLMTVDEPQPNTGWDVLSGPYDSNWGTGYDATVQDDIPGWPTAAKTGTTDNNEDAWYVGFTPLYTAAVWLGYDQPKPFPGLYGGVYAGPIFRQTLTAALKPYRPIPFRRPPGVVQAPIDIKAAPWTTAAPGPLTPPGDVRQEWFIQGTQPTKQSPLWVQEEVAANNPSLLWEPACGGTPVTRVFLNRQRYGQAWAQLVQAALGGTWQEYVPLDMALAPPTRTCLGTPAPALPQAAATATAPQLLSPPAARPAAAPPAAVPPATMPPVTPPPQNATAAAPAPAAPSTAAATYSATSAAATGSEPACQAAWQISLQEGQPMTPAALCVPLGQTAALTFTAADGLTHDVIVSGYGQEVVVPADGSPVTLTFVAATPGSFAVTDAGDSTEVARLTVR